MINDQPNQVRYAFGGDKKLESDQYGFYIQDDIRLTNRVQINPGLRYEYYTPLVGVRCTTICSSSIPKRRNCLFPNVKKTGKNIISYATASVFLLRIKEQKISGANLIF